MNLCAPFPVVLPNREPITLRPLTVRDRLAVSNLLISNASTRAIALTKALGISGKEAADFVANRVDEAERVSALVMSCFTLEGSAAILARACASVEDVETIGSSLEPGEVGKIAARCLGVEFPDDATTGNSSAGNARGQPPLL